MATWFGSVGIDFAVLLIATFIAIYLFYVQRFKFWKKQGIFSLPPKFPFGNTTDIILRRISFPEGFRDLYFEYKKTGERYGGFYFVAQKIFLPLDPELIKHILTKDFQYFPDRGVFYNEESDPLSAHLFALDSHKWRRLRSKLTPTFTTGKMKMMFPTLVNCGEPLKIVMDKFVQTGEPIDIKDVLARYATDIIGSCAFGIECNSLVEPDNEFRKYGKRVFSPTRKEIALRTITFSLPKFLQDLFNCKVFTEELSKFYMDIVKSTIDYREKNNIHRNDFMHLLLQLKNDSELIHDKNKFEENTKAENGHKHEDSPKLTVNEIAAQCFVFFLAGFETSSTTMTFCLYELARNSEIQEKLRQEIFEYLKKDNGQITYESIKRMPYLDKVVSETLRKYPPVPVLNRRCTVAYKIPDSNHVLQPGQKIFIPVSGIQWDPEYYPEPEKFDPERFTEEEKAKRHPYTYLPFGEGPRNCIGLRFGLMQTKVGLTLLLSNYRLTVNSKTREPLVMNPSAFIPSTKGDIWLNVANL